MELKEKKPANLPTFGNSNLPVNCTPSDWQVKPLRQLVTFLDEKRKPVKDIDRAKMRGAIPYYGASGIIDFVNDYLFDDDLILLAEDGENILSRNSRLAFQISGKAWVNNHAHVLKPNPEMNIAFLTEMLESLNYEKYNSGTAQPKLNKQTCYSLLISFPPKIIEQNAIAEALSDADALIESLEQLLSKKNQIKQGAMQTLLTGKRRLLTFTEDWPLKPIREIAPLQRGFDLLSSKVKFGPYPVVYSNGVLHHHNEYKVCEPGVITGRSGTIGKVTYVNHKFWPHNTSLWVTSFKGNNPLYIYYLFTHIGFERFATGSGVPTLNRNDVHEFKTAIPNCKSEQSEIVAILSAIDTEITTLETKLTKARQLKQAMMQKLLTGQIRLVTPSTEETQT